MELLGQLKLAGIRAAYDELVAAGVRAQHSFQCIFGELLLAQLADHRARSIAYRMGVARFPVIACPGVGAPDEPFMEGWTVLSALAAITSRIRLATLATSTGFIASATT